MRNGNGSSEELAASITRAASKQTYYTLRYLADRPLVADAYRAYAYFRWIDDQVDEEHLERSAQLAFMARQRSIMEGCYRGRVAADLAAEEQMLADLILSDQEENSGLQAYIRNMMAVIEFDARRRGRLISQLELARYTRSLAIAVTEVLHHFIGHGQPAPPNSARYMAVAGAHITHMLRDTLEDIEAGYFNIPREYLAAKGIGSKDIASDAYRAWVQQRAGLARNYFKLGKAYLAEVKNVRVRIAGYAYIARFEVNLEAIERLDYRLVPEPPRGRGVRAGLRLGGPVLALAFFPPRHD